MADQYDFKLVGEVGLSPQSVSRVQQGLADLQRYAPKINIGTNFDVAGKDVSQFTASLDRANQRVISFTSSVSVLYTTIKAFKDIVSATIEVDKALTAINSTMKLSSGNLDRFSKDLFDAARATSSSFEDAAEAAKSFARQGLSVEETLRRTKDALVLSRIAGIDAAESVKELTEAVNIFQKSGVTTTDVVKALSAVSSNFAISTKDVSDAFTRFGAVAQQAGLSFNQTISLITAVRQTSQREGAAIGTALTSIFERLQPKDAMDSLNALGVAVRDSKGNILSTLGVVESLAKGYDTLGTAQKAQIDKMIGGSRQIEILKAGIIQLANANGTFGQSMNVLSSGSNDVTARLNEQNKSISALLENFKTTSSQIGSNIGQLSLAPLLKGVLGAGQDNPITKALEDASGHADTAGGKIAEGLLRGIGDGLIYGLGPILLAAGAKVVSSTFGTLFRDIADQAGLNTQSKEQASIQKEIVSLYQRGGEELQLQLGLLTTMTERAALLQAILAKSSAAGIAFQAETGELAGAVYGIRHAAGGYLSVGAESAAIAAGVGGAPSSAHAVVIPNFRYGPGQVGPIVANSSEYKVDLGSGDAIYNQDMIKQLGLPSNAVPIAAGGYAPFGRGDGQQILRNASGQPLGNDALAAINDLINSLSSANGQAIAGAAASIKDILKTLNDASKDTLQRAAAAAAAPLFNSSSIQASPETLAAFYARRQASAGFGGRSSGIGSNGTTPFRDVTGVEKALGKDLRGLSDDQLQSLGGLTGGFGASVNGYASSASRGDTIQSIRGELSASQRRGGDADRIATTIGLGRSGTLNSDFANTVRTSVGSGATLEDAYKQASDAYIAAGGTAKRLAAAQTSLLESMIQYENGIKLDNFGAKATQGGINRQSTLNAAYQLLGQRRSFDTPTIGGYPIAQTPGLQNSLNDAQRAAVTNDLTSKAINRLGFGSLGSTADILSNPTAKAQVDQLVAQELAKIRGGGVGVNASVVQSTPSLYNRLNGRLQNGYLGLGAAIGLPLLGGAAEELGGAGDTGRGQAVGFLSGTLKGAGTGIGAGLAFGNPLAGGIIGAGIGGIKGFLDKLTQSFSELADEVAARNNKIKEDYDKASKVLNLQAQYRDAIADGDVEGATRFAQQRQAALGSIRPGASRITDLVIKPGALDDPNTGVQVNTINNAAASQSNTAALFQSAGLSALTASSYFKHNITDVGDVPRPYQADAINQVATAVGVAISKLTPDQLTPLKSQYGSNPAGVFEALARNNGVTEDQLNHLRSRGGAINNKTAYNNLIGQGIDQAFNAPATPGIDEDAIKKAAQDASDFEKSLRDMAEALKTAAERTELFNQGFIKITEGIQKATLETTLQTSGAKIAQQGAFDQANLRSSFAGQAQQLGQSANATLIGLVGKAQLGNDPTTQALIDQINGARDLRGFKGLQSYVAVNNGVAGALPTADKTLREEYAKAIKDTVVSFNKLNDSLTVSVAVVTTTNRLQQIINTSREKDTLLSNARYDPNAFASIQYQSSIGNTGSSRGARLQSLLGAQAGLSSLGLPDTPDSLDYRSQLQEQRTRQTLAQLVSNRLGRAVGSDDASLTSAAKQLQSGGRDGDYQFGSQILAAAGPGGLLSFNPAKQIAAVQDSIGGGDKAGFARALNLSSLSGGEKVLTVGLDKVAGGISVTNALLAQLVGNAGLKPVAGVGTSGGLGTTDGTTYLDTVIASEKPYQYGTPGKFSGLGGFGAGFSATITKATQGTENLGQVGSQVAEGILSSFNRAWDSFATGSEKAGKAFKSFIAGITADASRAFADQGIKTLLSGFGDKNSDGTGGWTASIGNALSSLISHNAEGGAIGFAKGGKVPAMLTGGEFYVSAQAAKSIGYDKLNAINKGYAGGGLVTGGSGMKDDVPASLDQGSFILRKSAVQRYGARNLQRMVNYRANGGRIGYYTGSNNGVSLDDQFSTDQGNANNMADYAPDSSNQLESSGGFDTSGQASSAAGSAAATTGNPFAGAIVGSLFSFVLGLVERYLSKSPGLLDTAQTTANATRIRDFQQNAFNNPASVPGNVEGAGGVSGGHAYLTPDGNGGYRVINYGGAAASVTNDSGPGYSSGGPVLSMFDSGGPVGPPPPMSSSSAPQVGVQVTVHNYGNGQQSATTSTKGSDVQSTAFAKQMSESVRQIVQDQLQQEMRAGGIFTQQRRYFPSASA